MRIRNIAMTLSVDSGATYIASGDMSNATVLSFPVFLGQIVGGFSIQAIIAGGAAPTGTFKLQCSNDASSATITPTTSFVPTNWTDVAGSSASIVNNGDITWNVQSANYEWLRLVYTRVSGTGTLTSRCFVKGIS